LATNRELRNDLLTRLGVTQQRLSQRAAQVKRVYGPMSTEEGTYVLAHLEGLDLSRYLDRETVDRVRSMLPKDAKLAPAERSHGRARKPHPTKPVRVAPRLEAVDVMLPSTVADDANRMALIYPKLYVFENSLRNVIRRVLADAHGTGWWSKCAPTEVKSRVADRKAKEGKKPWHGKRGSHEIYYSDFGDLKNIISKNWSAFQGIFPKLEWITLKLEELEPPRNVVAHNNPLSKQDEKRIELYYEDWSALLNDRRDRVP